MKTSIKIILVALASAGLSQAAVTITAKNFTSLSAGIPVLDDAGAAVTSGNRSWSVGYFSTGFDFNTATAATIKAAFTLFGTTQTAFATNGIFTGNSSATLPANDASFTGKTIYTLVGNAPTIAGSSTFAIFTANVLFPVVDALGNGSATTQTTLANNVVFGKLMAPTTQPAGGTFAQGVQMLAVAVPEPSAVLLGALGALGLLRRRR